MSKKTMQWIVIIVAIIAIIVIVLFMIRKPAVTLPAPVQINTQNQPTMGNPNAPIHIVAFEDLKCANCMRFNIQLLPKIKKAYIDTGKAKYTFINLAFIPGSQPAALTARCVYDQNTKLFFDYVDHLYHHQPPENENWATIPYLLSMATQIKNINQQKLMQCIVSQQNNNIINQNMKIAEKIMPKGVATPSLYINGILVNPLTWLQITAVIGNVK